MILRRDDGATTVVANVRELGRVHAVDVPLKTDAWTLNEYEGFALEPDTGHIHESGVTRSIIQVGADSDTARLAHTLGKSRARLSARNGS